jgi:hypothetical protein
MDFVETGSMTLLQHPSARLNALKGMSVIALCRIFLKRAVADMFKTSRACLS